MNQTATALVVEWLDSLTHARRLSPHTVRAYAASLHGFVGFLVDHLGGPVNGNALAALTQNDFRAYLAHRRNDGLGDRSVMRALAAIRAFFHWLERRCGIANARINTPDEVWGHPQLRARDRWREMDSPVGLLATLLPRVVPPL